MCQYIYIYVYVYIYMCICIYAYIYVWCAFASLVEALYSVTCAPIYFCVHLCVYYCHIVIPKKSSEGASLLFCWFLLL